MRKNYLIIARKSESPFAIETKMTFNDGSDIDTDVVIAQGLVRREKTEEVLRRITELGAYGYVQVAMERSVVKVKETKDSKLDRMKSIVKEACEQSHRNRLMKVYDVHSFKEFINDLIFLSHFVSFYPLLLLYRF